MSSPSPDQTSPRSTRRSAGRSGPLRRAAWTVEERVVWAGTDAARSVAASAAWPFERVAWATQRRLVWPLQDGLSGRGRLAHVGLVIGLVAAASGASVAGAQLAAMPDASTSAEVGRVAVAGSSAAATERAATPAAPRIELQGSPPSFDSTETVERGGAAASRGSDARPDAAAGAAAQTPAPVQINVTTQKVPSAALGVARRFAEAFVLYEVGEAGPQVRLAFRSTATPALTKALADRPPRQPAAKKVPRARVLNVVGGPRYGRTASISVALLRLGNTSELRLQMTRGKAGWRVEDVRG